LAEATTGVTMMTKTLEEVEVAVGHHPTPGLPERGGDGKGRKKITIGQRSSTRQPL